MGNVRHPALTGQQLIAGLWFPIDWFAGDELRKRVLGVWQMGAALYHFPAGHLLRLREPQLVDCQQLPGWPLCRLGETLASALFTESERTALPAADVWLVVGAQVIPLRLADGELIDPAIWIGLDDYA